LREKPGVTWEHGSVISELGFLLRSQLDRGRFRVVINDWRVRQMPGTIFVPDLLVVPTDYGAEFRGRPGLLAIFSQPLPLVVEVWSASTGNYDVDAKVPVYQLRGDLEIWRIHPYDRTITAWKRQRDGSYQENMHQDGRVWPTALPNVHIDLAELFAD
jgi:Uma2 family endonuclease